MSKHPCFSRVIFTHTWRETDRMHCGKLFAHNSPLCVNYPPLKHVGNLLNPSNNDNGFGFFRSECCIGVVSRFFFTEVVKLCARGSTSFAGPNATQNHLRSHRRQADRGAPSSEVRTSGQTTTCVCVPVPASDTQDICLSKSGSLSSLAFIPYQWEADTMPRGIADNVRSREMYIGYHISTEKSNLFLTHISARLPPPAKA